METVLDGFAALVENHAKAAKEAAEAAADPDNAAYLRALSEDLTYITHAAPATFRQALNLVWLCHIAFVLQGKYAQALGRMDQYLYPYYRHDIDAGLLTEEMAEELVACTFIKIKERRWTGGDDVVNICIGGVKPDGSEGINELSYVILHAVRDCNIPGPNLSARLHTGMPDKFLDECLQVIGTGLAASPGAACGKVVFTAETATDMAKAGHKVILVRLETSPEDIEGMHYAQGVLTVRGGMTSHAAVVARGMGTCCVSGCGAIKMDEANKKFELGGKTYKEGDWISIDGSTGNIYGEKIKTAAAAISGDFNRIMNWADQFRVLDVRTNADTPNDAAQAFAFGAQGIGLCRTEHMFFEADRIKAMREMIVSETSEQREKALAKLEPIQQSDFEAIYEAMKGRPVTIRLLDPPLHEFVPTDPKDIEELAKEMNISVEHLKQVISSLHEFNPMMGHRGCRLDVTFPEIAKMQTAAIIKAALAVRSRRPAWKIVPEIMVPLVGEEKELAFVKSVIDQTAKKIIKAAGSDMTYKVGTMIEIPRAALTADAIANQAEFFSFGTNDLTQMTFGFSRDDAGKFLASYYDNKIYESDPFSKLDQAGVGRLVKMAAELGRQTRPDIKLGICGEQGGDPSTVEFCHNIGLSYVSCSPFRVPIARLAAAQAAIKNARK